jgi:hypothetical protein
MKNIHIENSYKIWDPVYMRLIITNKCFYVFHSYYPEVMLNRNYCSMYIEWWMHNIGYYITKPFCFIGFFNNINLRCKDVDLEKWVN